jgi:hypothetical protein
MALIAAAMLLAKLRFAPSVAHELCSMVFVGGFYDISGTFKKCPYDDRKEL